MQSRILEVRIWYIQHKKLVVTLCGTFRQNPINSFYYKKEYLVDELQDTHTISKLSQAEAQEEKEAEDEDEDEEKD